METIHILGSEGFIGHAIQRVANSVQLHCWSHGSSKYDHAFNLLDPSSWQALINQQPTHVILLSWPGLPNYQESYHITRNLPACIELIDQLIAAGLQRIVIAGTCYEYGLQNGPLHEDLLTDPVNCYAIAKDSLRRVVASRCTQTGSQWCWLRIFYPYGTGQNPNSFLPSLIRAIQTGEQSFAMSSGRQLRDFVQVEVIARQLLLLCNNEHAIGVYNGGSGQPRSLLEIAEDTIKQHNSLIALQRGAFPDRSDEPLAFWANMEKFNKLQSIYSNQQ